MGSVGFWESWELWKDAVLAASVGGVLLAYLGFFVVLTHNAFVSSAVSHLAGLGVVVAIILGFKGEGSVVPLLFGICFGMFATGLFALPRRQRRIAADVFLAMTVIGASAVTMLLARYLTQEYRHVQATLYGDAVVASTSELYTLVAVGLVVGLLHFFFHQRFLLLSFDPDAARAQGMNTTPWAILLGLTIGLSISAVTRGLGALPAFSFTVVLPAAALLLTNRLQIAFLWAAIFALFSATFGYYLSFVADLPTGPTMVGVCLMCALLCGTFALFRRM